MTSGQAVAAALLVLSVWAAGSAVAVWAANRALHEILDPGDDEDDGSPHDDEPGPDLADLIAAHPELADLIATWRRIADADLYLTPPSTVEDWT